MIKKTGLIAFKLVNKGSKSEHNAPFLIVSDEEHVRLYFRGDNPFSHDMLRKFENKSCELTGDFDKRKKCFLVSEIVEVPVEKGEPEKEKGGAND